MADTIHQEVVFPVSPERVYEALIDSRKHAEFTGAPATISREAGGEISTHGGVIQGRNIELVPNRRIVQAWRVKDWEEGLYSVVRYEFKPEGSNTRLVLDHTAFPDAEKSHLESGWHAQYWEPLGKYLS
jgi:uncharacterized protein YndB with AHSA1/START domain